METKFNKFSTYWTGKNITDVEYLIKYFENNMDICLPVLYKDFRLTFNNTSICQNCFDFQNSLKEEDGRCVKFSNFGFKNNVSEPIEEEQKHLQDPIYYGVPNLIGIGSTAEGDTLCFDYRDDPKTCEPKVVLLVHDEYEETNGTTHMKIENIADSFDEFLDMLYEYKDNEE